MVDVSSKSVTSRKATAEAIIFLGKEAFELLKTNSFKKGDVLTVAKIAGISGAKMTSTLIPLCHPVMVSHSDVAFTLLDASYSVLISASAGTSGQTGVEMEAMTAASIAALTVYDMVKAVARGAVIQSIHLVHKEGGRSGVYDVRQEA
jgi:molybdenum cofactor biosynthesis protein MoaC